MCTFQSFNVCVYFGSKWYCTVFILLFFFNKCLTKIQKFTKQLAFIEHCLCGKGIFEDFAQFGGGAGTLSR